MNAKTSSYPIKSIASRVIPLWMRKGKDRELCLRYWVEAHGPLVARNRGLHEYRQHHFESSGAAVWPDVAGVRRDWLPGWQPDGMPEVTTALNGPNTESAVVTTPLFLKDESNVFDRSLMYRAEPEGSIWHRPSRDDANAHLRVVVFLRRRAASDRAEFSRWLHEDVSAQLVHDRRIGELRTYTFLPYEETKGVVAKDSDVDHDHPASEQFHALLIASGHSRDDLAGAFAELARSLPNQGDHIEAAWSVNVRKTFVVVAEGQITTVGLRGAYVDELIRQMGAENQVADDVRALFVPAM